MINIYKINYYPDTIKNAVIILLTSDNRIMLIRDKYRKLWMNAGGGIEKTDLNSWEAARREFYEETGYDVPESIVPVESYIYKKKTILYKVVSNKIKGFKINNEADMMKFPKLFNVLNGSFQKQHGKLKYYVIDGLKQMIKDKFLPIY